MKVILSREELNRLQNGETLNRGGVAFMVEETKALFINSLGESFFDGDIVYNVDKTSLSIFTLNIDKFESDAYKAHNKYTEIMIKASAEQWVKDHKNKEPKFKLGDIITRTEEFSPFRITDKSTLSTLSSNTTRLIHLNQDDCKVYVEAELEDGKVWSQEKERYLKLKDVVYKAETRQDLKDIIVACPVDKISQTFSIGSSYPYVRISTFGNIISCERDGCKIRVPKETFKQLLAHHSSLQSK